MPERPDLLMKPRGTLGIMAKTPALGEVKTRLAERCGDEAALAFAQTCLLDTWHNFSDVPYARTCLVLAGSPLREALQPAPDVWPQVSGDLGARMAAALHRALRRSPWAILIGTDSPGLPHGLVHAAAQQLQRGADSVLGPADDGGFYLIGLRRCPDGLLEGLPWSSEQTYERTKQRLHERGFAPHELGPWFDVDTWPDLKKLKAALEARSPFSDRHCSAPNTAQLLREHPAFREI